jgi:hypothetical protein
MDVTRQTERLNYLWRQGAYDKGASKARAFSRLHLRRNTAWYRSVPPDSPPAIQE